MNHSDRKNIALGVSAVLLLVALINGLPYGYFTFMRIIVCISAIYSAWVMYNEGDEKWIWFFGIIAILLNPIVPIHLDREVWVWIDGVVGILLLGFTFIKK